MEMMWMWRYTLTDYFIRSTCTPAHSYSCPISHSRGWSREKYQAYYYNKFFFGWPSPAVASDSWFGQTGVKPDVVLATSMLEFGKLCFSAHHVCNSITLSSQTGLADVLSRFLTCIWMVLRTSVLPRDWLIDRLFFVNVQVYRSTEACMTFKT